MVLVKEIASQVSADNSRELGGSSVGYDCKSGEVLENVALTKVF